MIYEIHQCIASSQSAGRSRIHDESSSFLTFDHVEVTEFVLRLVLGVVNSSSVHQDVEVAFVIVVVGRSWS